MYSHKTEQDATVIEQRKQLDEVNKQLLRSSKNFEQAKADLFLQMQQLNEHVAQLQQAEQASNAKVDSLRVQLDHTQSLYQKEMQTTSDLTANLAESEQTNEQLVQKVSQAQVKTDQLAQNVQKLQGELQNLQVQHAEISDKLNVETVTANKLKAEIRHLLQVTQDACDKTETAVLKVTDPAKELKLIQQMIAHVTSINTNIASNYNNAEA